MQCHSKSLSCPNIMTIHTNSITSYINILITVLQWSLIRRDKDMLKCLSSFYVLIFNVVSFTRLLWQASATTGTRMSSSPVERESCCGMPPIRHQNSPMIGVQVEIQMTPVWCASSSTLWRLTSLVNLLVVYYIVFHHKLQTVGRRSLINKMFPF